MYNCALPFLPFLIILLIYIIQSGVHINHEVASNQWMELVFYFNSFKHVNMNTSLFLHSQSFSYFTLQ